MSPRRADYATVEYTTMPRLFTSTILATATTSFLCIADPRVDSDAGTTVEEKSQGFLGTGGAPGDQVSSFTWKINEQGNLTCSAKKEISSDPARVRLAAARELYGPQEAEFFAGRVNFEGAYIWSHRWMEAEASLDDRRAGKIRAAESHLARVKEMEKRVKEWVAAGNAGTDQYLESDFYRADAEVAVSQATGVPLRKTAIDPFTQRLGAARLMFDRMWNRLEKGHAGGSFAVVHDWSRRILEADTAIRTESRLAAAQAHLERMENVAKLAKDWSAAKKLSIYALDEAKFYRADAAFFVLKAGGSDDKEARSEIARVRRDAAKATYEAVWTMFLDRRAYPESVYEWSIRWQKAALVVATTPAEKVNATEAHLARVKELRKTFEQKYQGLPARHLLACELYCAEAELLLGELGQRRP